MFKHAIAAMAMALALGVGAASGGVVTFESFNEGATPPNGYTDPATGYKFNNGPFAIEYADRPEYGFFFTNNKFLGKGGYSSGTGFGLLVGFDLSVLFPAPAERAGADIGWSTFNGTGQIELRGYDALNNLVGSATFPNPAGGGGLPFGSTHLEVSAPPGNATIVRLEFDSTNMGSAYDNVFAVVPEPAAATLCGAGGCILLPALRRRTRGALPILLSSAPCAC
jgi:hypothetical protein